MRGEEQLNADRMFADLDIETSYAPVDVDMNDGYIGNYSDDDDNNNNNNNGLSDLTSQIHKVTRL